MNYKEVKKDFVKLINMHGYPYDMTGGFVEGDYFAKLVLNPSEKFALKIIKDIIIYGFQWGEYYRSELKDEISIHDCDYCMYMYKKYITFEV